LKKKTRVVTDASFQRNTKLLAARSSKYFEMDLKVSLSYGLHAGTEWPHLHVPSFSKIRVQLRSFSKAAIAITHDV
jgi:hypothetical protein